MEKVVETKSCKQCSISFDITDRDIKFYEKVSPIFWWKKYSIPSPTLCPDCRRQRILAFRNERNLYRRQAHNSGKDIVSIYSPDKPYIVLEQDFWWASFDASTLFLDFDFTQTVFSQFEKLLKLVPKRALIKGTTITNTEYGNGIGGCKDCYLIFATSEAENCYYAQGANFSKNCVDCLDLMNCENCYQVVDGNTCYECFYSQKVKDCKSSLYLYNCTNCEFCFGCANLSHKKYYIHNEEFSKDTYFQRIQELQKNYSIQDFQQFLQKFPRQNFDNIGGENILWDLVKNSKDVYMSFDVQDSENVRYSCHIYGGGYDIMDVFTGLNGSHTLLESGVINKTSNTIIFSNDCWSHCQNLMYCTECKTCKNCLLCTWLVSKEYCILNKQYTKEEYEQLVPKIIEHMMSPPAHSSLPPQLRGSEGEIEWGQFFPASISPFGYNESVASQYYPLPKDTAIISGFHWSNYEAPFPKVDKIIPAERLPDDIAKIPDDILNWAIECEDTKKPFRITKQELEFYRKYSLPIPRKHPEQRHMLRMSQRNARKIYERKCDACGKEMKTTYSWARPEKVYCESCYTTEIY